MELIIDKDIALKNAKKTNSQNDWFEARNLRNYVGSIIDKAKSNYIEEEILSSKNDTKKFWRNINSVLPKNKNKNKNKITLKNEYGEFVKEDETANHINSFFTKIGPKLAEKFDDNWKYFGNKCEIDIPELKIRHFDVVRFIKEIDITKSSGIDRISSHCIKDALLALSAQLTYIFEISIKYNIFPDCWKVATIVPLFKGGKKDDVSNYRPVSLLPVTGKILEKIIHSHLSEFFEKNNLLCDFQGGFRKKHSTLGSINNLTTDIFNAINNKESTMATFFDLKKAFDTVNHKILIKKLQAMGIKGGLLEWIEDYLSNRFQRTVCNNNLSTTENITCGVPQGSILGPLLFLVYINDIENVFCDVKFQLYADDTVIYYSGKNGKNVNKILQKGVDKFIEWSEINQLTINIKKTKVMIFGSRYNIKKNDNVEISIKGEILQTVPTCKYLGIYMDQNLNFNYHLKNVINTISYKLYIFSKIRTYLTEQSAIIVYKTMVLPYFDYGDVVFMFSNKKLLSKLDRLHKRGLKISIKLSTNFSDIQLFNYCNISNLENRRIVHLRNFLFNRKHLCENNENEETMVCTRAKSGPVFNINKPNCEAYKRSICYSGGLEWNNLNSDIRNIDNLFEFKKIQKNWLLKTYKQ